MDAIVVKNNFQLTFSLIILFLLLGVKDICHVFFSSNHPMFQEYKFYLQQKAEAHSPCLLQGQHVIYQSVIHQYVIHQHMNRQHVIYRRVIHQHVTRLCYLHAPMC